jgi:flagellar hook-associated protein 3 FlgL
MITRIGTFSHTSAMISASLRTQAKFADQQTKEATGLKSTSYGGLSKDAASVLRLASQSSRLTADNTAASSASSYVQAAYSAVGEIADLATSIKSQLASLLSASTLNADTLATYAQGWLDDLQTQLNGDLGGAYLFSGEAVETAPVDFSAATYDPTTSGDTGYYQGATTGRVFTASDGSKTALSVSADNAAFEELARALSSIIADPGDTTVLASAIDLVGQSITDLGAAQETLGVQAASLASLVERNTSKIDTLDSLASELKDADLTQAAVLVVQYQTQLEALYSTISSLSSVSLLKYL